MSEAKVELREVDMPPLGEEVRADGLAKPLFVNRLL